MLVNPCGKIRFDRKEFLRPPPCPWKEEKKRAREDESSQWRRCHERLTISDQATTGKRSYHAIRGPSTTDEPQAAYGLKRLAPITRIFL